MTFLVLFFLVLLASTYGDLAAEAAMRELELSTLRMKIADLENRLYEVEQRPDIAVPAQRLLYRN